jgi:hypothetical protein
VKFIGIPIGKIYNFARQTSIAGRLSATYLYNIAPCLGIGLAGFSAGGFGSAVPRKRWSVFLFE